MMDRGTVQNMQSFIPKINFEKLIHLVGFITRIYHDAWSPERQIPWHSVWRRKKEGKGEGERRTRMMKKTMTRNKENYIPL